MENQGVKPEKIAKLDSDFEFDFEYEDDDEAEFQDEEELKIATASSSRINVTSVFDQEKIIAFMYNYAEELKSDLEITIPSESLFAKLNELSWNRKDFFINYQDNKFPDLLKEPVKIDLQTECQICMTDYGTVAKHSLNCGHVFCQNCWTDSLNFHLVSSQLETFQCLEMGCKAAIDRETVFNFIKDSTKRSRFDIMLVNNFVKSHPQFIWCPSVDCGKAIYIDSNETGEAFGVRCSCDHSFCSICEVLWHSPVSCHSFKKWYAKIQDKEWKAIEQWILKHCKPCPRCGDHIEKNGGCNVMTCRKCGQIFCWICLEKTHHFHYCLKKDLSKQIGVQKMEARQRNYRRYIFYSQFYHGHLLSLRLEKKLKKNLWVELEDLGNKFNLQPGNLVIIKKAFDELLVNRQILVHSFIFMYFTEEEGNQFEIFKMNQKMLQERVENLSQVLESFAEERNEFNGTLGLIEKKTQFCEGVGKILVDHVKEGYAENYWKILPELHS